MEYLYIRSNPEWINKFKFGYSGKGKIGLINRFKSSITEHSPYSKYERIFVIEKQEGYNFYKEFDKIFSIFCKRNDLTEPMLIEFKKYLFYNRVGEEFVKKDGLDLMVEIIINIFPKFKLKFIRELDIEELKDIENTAIKEFNIENYNIKDIIKREYQEEVLIKMIDYYKNNNNGKLIWACGLGKTLMSLFYILEMGYKKICIGTPSIFLQTQFKSEIDMLFNNYDCLILNGFNNNIKKFLNNDNDKIKFIITTYDSSKHLIKDNIIFDFKIGDEAHHLVSGYESFHNINSYKSLFMTATEKINIDGEKYSMDNIEIYGNEINNKNIKWAIDNKKITDYNILLLRNNEEEINEILISLEDKNIDNNLFVSCYLTLKALVSNQFPILKHLLIYTNTTENSDKVIKYINFIINFKKFNTFFKERLYLVSLHSNNKKAISNEIKKFEESEYGIISCVYILGEGFNLPKLTGVVIAEKMQSEIRIVQSCLRANRLDINNPYKQSFILIPSSYNNDEDNFQKAKQIITNFMSNDEAVMMKIKCVDISKKYNKREKDEKENFNIEIKNLEEFEKLKLKLISSKDLNSSLKYEENEYNILKNFNIRLGISSIEEYNDNKENRNFYIIYPRPYFEKYGLWKNWYHFLGINTDKFIQDKDEWIKFCKKINIKSKEDYYKEVENYKELPSMPDQFYLEFKGLELELNIIPYIF
jgi:superfamily II DNA or RNA helicase